MTEKSLGKLQVVSWEGAKNKIENLIKNKKADGTSFLFRGQSDSEWPLKTTLDRSSDSGFFLVKKYHEILMSFNSELSFFGEIECYNFDSYGAWDDETWLTCIPEKTYALMIYLRHHGFPSPLLDWSRSLDIAAYFAFYKIRADVENVSIFIFQECKTSAKYYSGGDPHIVAMGHRHTVPTHIRHSRQQCEYTFCVQKDGQDFRYVPHKKVLDRKEQEQDSLIEIVIPASEKDKVWQDIVSRKIGKTFLFPNEDKFIQKLGKKYFCGT